MQYYHNLITEESFNILKSLNRRYNFVLIGGWAVFLYAGTLKSKDIDIILDYEELSKMKEEFEIIKNERLEKYEIKIKGIDIDIYLPYFSNPGLPAQEIKKFTFSKAGFLLPIPEILLILKQNVFLEREESSKGAKDKIDIFSLLLLPNFNFKKYEKILKEYKMDELIVRLKELFKKTNEIKEIGLSKYKMARLKKKILKEI